MFFIIYICVGNKSDLEDLRQVPSDEVLQFADQHQIFLTLETSAKDNVNVEEAFVSVARVSKHSFVFLNVQSTRVMHSTLL